MKKAVGGAYVYNLVIVFLLIAFGFLMATVSYSKAYRVSKAIVSIIENHSGYAGTGTLADKEIARYLTSIGYNTMAIDKKNCPVRKNASGQEVNASWSTNGVCIYQIDTTKYKDPDNQEKTLYVTYGVVSYMRIDLPLIELIKVPIYGETEKIYVFN